MFPDSLNENKIVIIENDKPRIDLLTENFDLIVNDVLPNKVFITLTKDECKINFNSSSAFEPLQFEVLNVSKQGLPGQRGRPGDKGDKLLYTDLTLLEKQEIASFVEIDTGIFTTDLLANYILNKE